MSTSPEPWTASGDLLGSARDRAARWLNTTELAAVVRVFDPGFSPHAVTEFSVWSQRELDTRRGVERQAARPADWTRAQVDALRSAAEPLGMMASAPPTRRAYETAIVLAGTATANRLRSALAQEVRLSGVSFGAVVALGSARAITPQERALHPDAASETEWHDLACVLADTMRCPAQLPEEGAGPEPVDLEYRCPDRLTLRVVSAPAREGRQRANTADALSYLGSRWRDPGHVLLLSSAMYVPYTYFTAALALHGLGIASFEVIGTPSTHGSDDLLVSQVIAQEINSAVQAAHEL